MTRLFELPAYQRLPVDPVSASGDRLLLANGEELLDLYGGHCVNTLGAGHAGLLAEISAQWQQLSFATNLLPLRARARFLAALDPLLPEGRWAAFLSNSGAEANENALKAALSATGRGAILCFEGAFHGRTAAATWTSDVKYRGFPRPPFEVRRVPFGDLRALDAALDTEVACAILEPIQSLAGVVDPPAGFLERLRERCTAVGAALIFDEVQTGNGRLGTPFAAQYFDVLPDAITTAKGVAGGLPVGLTLFSAALVERMDPKLCGSTFGGGPLALTAAAYIAEQIGRPGFLENVRAASQAFRAAAAGGPVARVRGAGLLLGLELEPGLEAKSVQLRLLEQGVFVGTSNHPRVLRLSPALTISPSEAAHLGRALASLEVHA
jgi:acetylornithine/succinyldiaminopimelate/putrescine aminotransferase